MKKLFCVIIDMVYDRLVENIPAILYMALVCAIAYYYYSCTNLSDADFKTPEINKIERRDVIEYADTSRFCDPYCNRNFCARVRDSVKVIDYNLRCGNCGSAWGQHKTRFEWVLETQPYN